MEAINRPLGYAGVREYVASAANLLGVVEGRSCMCTSYADAEKSALILFFRSPLSVRVSCSAV